MSGVVIIQGFALSLSVNVTIMYLGAIRDKTETIGHSVATVLFWTLFFLSLQFGTAKAQCVITDATLHHEGKIRNTYEVKFKGLTEYPASRIRQCQESHWITKSITVTSEQRALLVSKYGMDCVVHEVVKWSGCRDERKAEPTKGRVLR